MYVSNEKKTPIPTYRLLSSPSNKPIVFVSSRGTPCMFTSICFHNSSFTFVIHLKVSQCFFSLLFYLLFNFQFLSQFFLAIFIAQWFEENIWIYFCDNCPWNVKVKRRFSFKICLLQAGHDRHYYKVAYLTSTDSSDIDISVLPHSASTQLQLRLRLVLFPPWLSRQPCTHHQSIVRLLVLTLSLVSD